MAQGVLTLTHREAEHFSQRVSLRDVELVRLLHDQMALLIKNARLRSLRHD